MTTGYFPEVDQVVTIHNVLAVAVVLWLLLGWGVYMWQWWQGRRRRKQ